jgi:serine/threonine-protein phosphatase 6 regulatory ankyrin repeat subunit B
LNKPPKAQVELHTNLDLVEEENHVEEEVEEDQDLSEIDESDPDDSDIEIEEQDELDGSEFLWEHMTPGDSADEEEEEEEEEEVEQEIVREEVFPEDHSSDVLDSVHEPAHEIPEQISGDDEIVPEPEEGDDLVEFSFRRPPAEVRRHFPFPSHDQESLLGEPAEVVLFHAVDANNMKLVRKCLSQGANVEWVHPEKERKTCIHVAAEKGLLNVLKLLISKGGKSALDKQDKDGWSALHWAAYNDHSDCVRELWTKGAPMVKDMKEKTAVYWTGRQHHTTAAATLIELALSSSSRSSSSSSSNGSSEVATDKQWRPIHLASARGDAEGLSATLGKSRGAAALSNSGGALVAHDIVDAVETVGCCGLRPLHLAAMCWDAKCVRELLAIGAAIDTADAGGKTALHRAARSGSVAVLQVLLDHAAERDALNGAAGSGLGMQICGVVDEDGRTALHDASYNGHIAAARLLTEAGAPFVDVRELDGSTPLLLAAYNGHSDLVTLLIGAGADVSAHDVEGRTPLHDACMNGHLGVVQTLLAHGANVLARNSFGRTPLHDACSSSHAGEGMRLPGSMQAAGEEEMESAKRKGGSLAVELLLFCTRLDSDVAAATAAAAAAAAAAGAGSAVGAAGAAGTGVGPGALITAATSPDAALSALGARHISAGAGLAEGGLAFVLATQVSSVVHMVDAEGLLPIHEAAAHGATEAVRLMIAMGAPVGATKRDGQTALHLAAAGGHTGMLGLLLSHGEGEELLDRGDSNGDCPLHWAAFKGQVR